LCKELQHHDACLADISDSILMLLWAEIGSTISNLFGGGSYAEETDKVSPEGSSEESVPEVHCAVVVARVFVCR